jgi:hypothetical protein
VLTNLRGQAEGRRDRNLQRQLLEQQIVSGKMADQARVENLELDRQRLVDQRKAAGLAYERQQASTALAQAQFQATAQQTAIENRRAKMTQQRQLMQLIASALPEGVSLSLSRLQQEAGGNRYLPGVGNPPVPLETDIATAQGRSRPGLQGSATRPRTFGTANGVTFDPGTVNYNAPSGGPRETPTQNAVDAALDTSFDLMDQMEAAVATDGRANAEPLLAAGLEGLSSNPFVKGVGLSRLGQLLAQGQRSDAQTQFHTAQELWPHIYAQFQAHTRNGPQYAAMIQNAMGAMSASVDPELRREKMQTIRNIINRVWIERHGTSPPTPGSRLMLQDRVGMGMPLPEINPRFAPPQP